MQISKDKTAEAATPGRRLISKPQVLQLIGNPAYSTVWEWMRAGTFPLPIELGPPGGRSSMIAWYADEIHDWIANRPRRKLGQHEFRGRSAGDALDAPEPEVRSTPSPHDQCTTALAEAMAASPAAKLPAKRTKAAPER